MLTDAKTGTMSGDYDAEVVVADTRFESSFKQKFGSIFVTHAQKSDGSIPSDPPLDAREVCLFALLRLLD